VKIGVVFPQTEIGASASAVRSYGTTVESLGYTHVLTYEHVLGADPIAHAPWTGGFDVDTTFREPFVMFGFLAAITKLELVTGVVILPQRQTALVAKQAAELDLLTEGRFRLGVGLGWNAVEYAALGQSFHTRGRRLNEQIPLLRRLWTERVVTHLGEFDTITGAGLSPLPVQRPIPVWIGGESRPAYERIGRLADGWFPQFLPGQMLDEARSIIRDAAVAAGREPDAIGMEGRVGWYGSEGLSKVIDQIGAWHRAGASHVSIHTMNANLGSAPAHLAALAMLASELAPFR
jgi:probable F420-dependent oxidoreductase